jgi:hypothetical protein
MPTLFKKILFQLRKRLFKAAHQWKGTQVHVSKHTSALIINLNLVK